MPSRRASWRDLSCAWQCHQQRRSRSCQSGIVYSRVHAIFPLHTQAQPAHFPGLSAVKGRHRPSTCVFHGLLFPSNLRPRLPSFVSWLRHRPWLCPPWSASSLLCCPSCSSWCGMRNTAWGDQTFFWQKILVPRL